ncbi:MAG: ABC transporter ATP-binding protein [Clostridiales bacterium]|jgi:iron complex transport system ATP-binding protein|nr:ABC transporter ATP-binding protein [Clostridiales bacterium]
MESVLAVREASVGYGGSPVVKGVDFCIPSGQISVLIGANACGKSTLLKAMARLLKPTSGEITLNGTRIDKISTKALARQLGLLPQTPIAPEGITVSELVGRGRFPHRSFLRGFTKEDYTAVAESMDSMKVSDLADRSVDELSGGQRQRVWIAMALAQRTDILLLDEPTTYLDVAHQIEILDMLTQLNRSRGTTIVMVLHEVNLAARYADHLFAMRDGKLAASGSPEKIFTESLVKDVFSLESVVSPDPVSGMPMMFPRGRYHSESILRKNI